MNTIKTLTTFIFSLLIATSCLQAQDQAQDQAPDHGAIMPYITEDVLAVGFVDLSTIEVGKMFDEFEPLIPGPDNEQQAANRQTARQVIPTVQNWLDELSMNGVSKAYVLFRISDLQAGGPTWVIPAQPAANHPAIIARIKTAGKMRDDSPLAYRRMKFQSASDAVLIAMNAEQLEQLAASRSDNPRLEAKAALDSLGDAHAGLTLFGNPDTRRVIREMFPTLPVPFDHIDGKMLANDIRWVSVAVKFPPELKMEIQLETTSPEIAVQTEKSVLKGIELLQNLLQAELQGQPELVSRFKKAFQMLNLKTNDSTIQLSFGDDPSDLASLLEIMALPIKEARNAAQRSQRMNQFKQLALAFLNFDSARRQLVTQAISDPNGKPLLSWRVQLLPYLEHGELYNQFHLDEPWDSPHNKTLIDKMPDVFADPDPTTRSLIGGAGRTTYVAAAGTGTLFPPASELPDGKPLQFKHITDGSSNTILFVEVVPERAVIWTKPDDWNVDFDNPLDGVQRTDRAAFVTAFCDGSVRSIANTIDAATLRAYLTRSGGEVITSDQKVLGR